MILYEKSCCNCAAPGYPCLENACENQFPRYFCDDCGKEFEKIYRYDGDELCIKCVEKRLEVVE